MLVMVSNRTGLEVGLLAGKFPNRIGHLFSPAGQRGPWVELPYGLDNGAWGAHLNKRAWDESGWRVLIAWAAMSGIAPLWAVVPDCVGNREETLRLWPIYEPIVKAHGFRPAFAAQDGMGFGDVPDDDCMIFIGGSTAWKLKSIAPWCAKFPGRIHVARVNTWDRLALCWRNGVVSVDGTGWFHKTGNQSNDLRKFLRETDGQRIAA